MSPTVVPQDTDTWHPARLIPTTGIRGQEEQERRATSCLLAVMGAVDEFGRALLSEVGAPKGKVSTFTEVQLKDPDGKLSIPDGVAVVQRGSKAWRCLIEVKTSGAPLKPEQVNRYLDMARQHKFDAVVTVSNQITNGPHDCPVDVDKRKVKAVALRHLSWWRIVTEAVVQHRHRGVSDPDQAWILGELIAYMDQVGFRTWAISGSGCAMPRGTEPCAQTTPAHAMSPTSGRSSSSTSPSVSVKTLAARFKCAEAKGQTWMLLSKGS